MWDVIVCGSGIACWSFLKNFREQPLGRDARVLVLEAGPSGGSGNPRMLSPVDFRHRGYMRQYDPNKFRNFQLGGTSNSWGGGLVEFDSEEFQLGADDFRYWPEDLAISYPELQSKVLSDFGLEVKAAGSRMQISQAEIGLGRWVPPDRLTIGAEVSSLADQILFESSVVDISQHQSGGIDHVSVETQSTSGSTGKFLSKSVVVAMGGLESTRLVLGSQKLMMGIRRRDLVGAYYSPHINFVAGIINPSRQVLELLDEAPADTFIYFSPTEKNSSSDFIKITLPSIRNDLRGYFASPRRLFSKRLPNLGTTRLINVAAGHEPSAESRISLNSSFDALGRNGISVKHHVSEVEADAVFKKAKKLSLSLASNLSDVSIPEKLTLRGITRGASHHMGGLVFFNSKGEGVVDNDLRLDGTKNIYVASSAVFPTYSHANPTLTICALATRLARKLGN